MESEAEPQLDDTYPYPVDKFIVDNYDKLDRLLAAEQEQPRDLHFSQITLIELISAQMEDAFCSEIHIKIDGLGAGESPLFRTDDNGLFVRTTNRNTKVFVPHSGKPRVLDLSHYLVFASHHGRLNLYYRTKQDFLRPALAADVYCTVKMPGICSELPQTLQRTSVP